MNALLDNPVYHALLTGDHHLGVGSARARLFDAEVSPFGGFEEGYEEGFDELHRLSSAGRTLLYATRKHISIPANWDLRHKITGVQMIYTGNGNVHAPEMLPRPLTKEDVPQMIELTRLTKPGPFGSRTIEFGHYYGYFSGERLVAMTGQRLHVEDYSEISAVCTHPDFLGRGYATSLMEHQVTIMLAENKKPFLHVRDDNQRAIDVYVRAGFVFNGPMVFYFMVKR